MGEVRLDDIDYRCAGTHHARVTEVPDRYTESLALALKPLLTGGETLLMASPLTPDPGITEDVSIRDELKNLLDPSILFGGSHPGELLRRIVFNRALIGGPETAAAELFSAVASAVGGPRLAVTDQRLLIFTAEIAKDPDNSSGARLLGVPDQVATLVHEVDRSAVHSVRRAPAGLLRRGRVMVRFGDGSSCALVCARPSLATRMTQLLTPPAESSRPE